MKKSVGYALVLTGCLIAGCMTSPLTQPFVQGRDDLVYQIPEETSRQIAILLKRFKEKSISVLVDCHVLTESGLIPSNAVPLIRENLQSDINSRLGSLSLFRVVPTDTAVASLTSQAYKQAVLNNTLGGLDQSGAIAKAENSDFTVIASLTYVSSAAEGAASGRAGYGGGAPALSYGADVKMAMELYDCNAKKALLTKTIQRKVSGASDVQSAIIKGLSDCAKEYMEIVADNFGARGRVLKTVGGGHFARVSLGLEDGLEAGSTVAFIQIAEPSDGQGESGGEDMVSEEVIAFGSVVGSVPTEKKAAWVEVDNWQSVRVVRGQLVKIVHVEQKSGFLNALGIGL